MRAHWRALPAHPPFSRPAVLLLRRLQRQEPTSTTNTACVPKTYCDINANPCEKGACTSSTKGTYECECELGYAKGQLGHCSQCATNYQVRWQAAAAGHALLGGLLPPACAVPLHVTQGPRPSA